jgi:uncharacterized protein YndB with AHSA1/START domain
MLLAADGTLEEIDGKTVLRFERRFAHPIERVWDVLTKPEHLAKWFCGTSDVDIDLVAGGSFSFRITGPPELVDLIGEDATGGAWTVRRVEPPRVFEHSFLDDPDSFVRYELQPDGNACRLVLTATVPSRQAAIEGKFLVGFHMSLEALEQVLDGLPAPWTLRRFDELSDRYGEVG